MANIAPWQKNEKGEKVLCKKRHQLTPENRRVSPSGIIMCLQCEREGHVQRLATLQRNTDARHAARAAVARMRTKPQKKDYLQRHRKDGPPVYAGGQHRFIVGATPVQLAEAKAEFEAKLRADADPRTRGKKGGRPPRLNVRAAANAFGD